MSYGLGRVFLLSYWLACCWPGLSARSGLRVVQQWPELQFNFPSEKDKRNAIEKRFYVRTKSIPIDVDVQHRQAPYTSRIFITIPRFDEGRPVTLGTVDSQGRISGYPNYSWNDNQGQNCDGLTSVFRTAIDECNRLWVMDTGKVGKKQSCTPQLLAFDLSTDEVVFRHRFDKSVYNELSLFITPVVDVQSDCEDTFVYVSDVAGFGLVVVDVAGDRSWRVTHRFCYPYPSRGSFTIDGVSFDLMDGVLGMALSPRVAYRPGSDRFLYFHALASTTENVVRTSVLRNSSFMNNPSADPNSIKVFQEERSNQSAAEAMDRLGILYFGLMEPPSIWCWNSNTRFSTENFHPIAVHRENLQFASGMKVINNMKGEQELWVLTSSFQRFITGTLNSNQVNFRIHAEKIPNLLVDSPCLPS